MKKFLFVCMLVVTMLLTGCELLDNNNDNGKVDCTVTPEHASCVTDVDCTENPDHEECKEPEVDCTVTPEHEDCEEPELDCNITPEHEDCEDNKNYLNELIVKDKEFATKGEEYDYLVMRQITKSILDRQIVSSDYGSVIGWDILICPHGDRNRVYDY